MSLNKKTKQGIKNFVSQFWVQQKKSVKKYHLKVLGTLYYPEIRTLLSIPNSGKGKNTIGLEKRIKNEFPEISDASIQLVLALCRRSTALYVQVSWVDRFKEKQILRCLFEQIVKINDWKKNSHEANTVNRLQQTRLFKKGLAFWYFSPSSIANVVTSLFGTLIVGAITGAATTFLNTLVNFFTYNLLIASLTTGVGIPFLILLSSILVYEFVMFCCCSINAHYYEKAASKLYSKEDYRSFKNYIPTSQLTGIEILAEAESKEKHSTDGITLNYTMSNHINANQTEVEMNNN